MQKVISINEFEKTLNSIDDIEEPIIIKRENYWRKGIAKA